MFQKKLKQLIAIVITLFVGVLLYSPNTVIASQFISVPSNGNFGMTCESEYSININTQGETSNAADIEIQFNPALITIIDTNPNMPGVQILPGNAYEAYAGNTVDQATGKIRLTGFSLSQPYFNGNAIFATVRFKSNPSVTGASFNIYFTSEGYTLDSNIAKASDNTDSLTSVTNANFTFTQQSCVDDISAPVIEIVGIKNNQINVPPNSIFTIKITDSQSNIDVANTIIIIDNKEYRAGDQGVTVTGGGGSYEFRIDPTPDLPANTAIILTVTTRDTSENANQSVKSIIFNNPMPEVIPPGEICDNDEECGINDGPTNIPLINTIVEVPIVKTIIETVTQFYDRFIPEPIKEIITTITIPGLISGFISLALLANIITFLLSLRSIQLLVLLFGMYFNRNKRPWGIVFDEQTKKPLPFASVRAYIKGTKTIVDQRITDEEGRYGLILSIGEYRVEVEHPNYQKYEFEIAITNDVDIVPKDVPLRPQMEEGNIVHKASGFIRSINTKFIKSLPFLINVGLFVSVIAFLFAPNIYNFIMLGLYMLLFVTQVLKKGLRIRRWGMVVDSSNNLRIPYAIVKLIDRNTWLMVDTQMTNQQGTFGLFNDPGRYAIIVSAKGYIFPSSKQSDLSPIEGKYGVLAIDIEDKNNLDVKLYLDPNENNTKYIDFSNKK